MSKTRSASRPDRVSEQVEEGGEVVVAGKRIKVSNLAKILYPGSGFTKGDAIDYYAGISETMVKHLRGRTVTLKRYPHGVEGEFFYEKNCPAHRPPWIDTKAITSKKRPEGVNYCLIDSKPALVWTAQLASLELHASLAKASNPAKPTMLAFDLDPGPPAGMLECIPVALKMRDTLAKLGLQSFPKTSGGKGLHFYVPLNTACTYDDTKQFARSVAELFEKDMPDQVVSIMRKDVRGGKIFIDWSQNDEHKTTVAVYSLRARQRPTVSTPVTWKELETALKKRDAELVQFEADEVIKRVAKLGDLFAPVLTLKQRLPRF